jgi:hypothetical protein
MSKYTTALAPVDTVQEAKAEIDQLVARMTAGLDAIAEAAGAQRCPHCGEWTMDLIDLTGEDEFGRIESEMFCKRCAPLTCAF